MTKNISELRFAWRYAVENAFGGYDYIEIDVHNSRFHQSDRASDSTHYAKIMVRSNGSGYIRYHGVTYNLD